MWKAAFAGVIFAVTATSALAQDYTADARSGYGGSYDSVEPAQRVPVVTGGHIARLKAALRLKPSQRKFWPAVEAALRRLGHRAAHRSAKSWSQRASAAVGAADALRRVVAAAQPLIGSLDEKQRKDGMRVIRALGFSSLASAL